MRHLIRLSTVIAAMATALLGGPLVLAHAAAPGAGAAHAVFVQTNDPRATRSPPTLGAITGP